MPARTTLPTGMDLNIELPMPALVRTDSASSTDSDSSPPTTPTSSDYLGCPFDDSEIDAKKQIIAHKKCFTSPRRRAVTVATSKSVQKKPEQEALSAMQVLFLIGILLVDALRIITWIPICLRIIFRELWIVLECELRGQGVDPEGVKRGLGVIIALVVCYFMFL